MNRLFSNLKPFITYGCVYAICAFITLIADGNAATWGIWALVLVCILNAVTGYTDGIKKIRWGIAAFGVMLAVCAVPFYIILGWSDRILGMGNLIVRTVFYYGENTALNILWAVLSVVLPLAPFFIGAAVRKAVQNKKSQNRAA